MKKWISTSVIVLMVSTMSIAQSVIRLKDPHIVGQEKRQVFQEWGDWKPKGKYFFGVQVNYHYTMVWGWLAPSRNRRYKRGDDIRPLSPAGLQNQRYLTTLQQEAETKKTKEDAEIVHDETFDEYMHVSGLVTEADPLYILYYKRELSNLKDVENIDQSNKEIKLKSIGMTNQTFKNNDKYGILENLVRDIATLGDKYKIARKTDMPRGKRIIMYHECLLEWRKTKSYIDYLNRQTTNRIKAEQRLAKLKQMKQNGKVTKRRRDAEIFYDVLMSNPIYMN